jgi:hypothetical protein
MILQDESCLYTELYALILIFHHFTAGISIFDVSLTVHLSITLANDQLDAQMF